MGDKILAERTSCSCLVAAGREQSQAIGRAYRPVRATAGVRS
jgi:hypothetical protein